MRDTPRTDDERRWWKLWKSFDGYQYGPHTETAAITYESFYKFCAALEKEAPMIDKCAAGYQEFPRAVEVESPWRTLDSAPRDGTAFLIWRVDRRWDHPFIASTITLETCKVVVRIEAYRYTLREENLKDFVWHPMPAPPEIKS